MNRKTQYRIFSTAWIVAIINCGLYAQQPGGKAAMELQQGEHYDAFKINLLSPFYGTLNLSWQHVLNNESSFQLTATYMDFDSYGSRDNTDGLTSTQYSSTPNSSTSIYTNVEKQLTRGFTLTPEYRFMLNGKNLSGSYIAPFVRYMYYQFRRDLMVETNTSVYSGNSTSYNVSYSNTSDLYTYQTLGVGMLLGKQFIFKHRIALDLFGGPVYAILMSSNKDIKSTSDIVIGSGIPNTYIRGYGVRAGITVGFIK